jgi:hypothetical protein
VKGIQISSNKGSGPFQRGDNYKNVKKKNEVGTFKNLILKNHKAKKAEIYMKAF